MITGASGLLGSFVLPLLQDHEVFSLGVNKPECPSSAKFHHLPFDLSSDDFDIHLPNSIEAVIHLAQSNHFKDFPEKAKDIVAVNALSTIKLLDYARRAKAKTFIYASSGAVYGTPADLCHENTALTVDSKKGLYYASKLASEMFVESYSNYMKTVILRFFFIYGPGQRKQMLIPRLVNSVLENKPISLQGNYGMKINPIYVVDAANAVSASLSIQQSTIINVAGSEVLSLRQIGETIAAHAGKSPCFDINHSETPIDLIGDVTKMQTLLTKPKISFSEGIKNYLNSVSRNN